jgi:hypothetical protein
MDETEIGYHFSPDRLKLLWLLLRKRGIDSAPQQIRLSEYATDQRNNELEPESAEKCNQENPLCANIP